MVISDCEEGLSGKVKSGWIGCGAALEMLFDLGNDIDVGIARAWRVAFLCCMMVMETLQPPEDREWSGRCG